MGRVKKAVEKTRVVSLQEKKDQLRTVFFNALQIEEKMDLDDWADAYRILPTETSSESGRWVTQRFPFLRKIMKYLSPSSAAKILTWIKGCQVGATEVAINWMLYTADHDPCPLLYTQKTEKAARSFSTQKLKPGIRECWKVDDTLGEDKPSGYADSWDNKAFPGGFLSISGADVPEALKSKSIKRAIVDEAASYSAGIGSDGSPLMMIQKRMVNFPDRKFYHPSTPQLEETCVTTASFKLGSQEYYYLPCPHCNPEADDDGFMFVLKWEHIKYSKVLDENGVPSDVHAECPHCAGRIDEHLHKTWMLDHGDWFSEKDSPGKRYRVDLDYENPSLHLSSFYSPFGFFSWTDAVVEWLEYLETKDVNKLQVIVNQTWAEPFSATNQEISSKGLYRRRERYSNTKTHIDVPSSAVLLTAGVDIQKDRIEALVAGHGVGDEMWAIDYSVFVGDTKQLGNRYGRLQNGQPSVWALLDQYLEKHWQHESGILMPVEFTLIDSKYNTDEVHIYSRLREHRRIYPVHGHVGWDRPYVEKSTRRHKKYATIDFTAGVDSLKSKLYSQLGIETVGPGYIHFPIKDCFDKKFFKGLTCESLEEKTVGGRKVVKWITPLGARNEPIDLFNYARAAQRAYPVDLYARSEAATPLPVVRKPPTKRKRKGSSGLTM